MSPVTGCELSTRSLVGDQRAPYSGPERRSNARVSLDWTVQLTCDAAGFRLRSRTRNISPNGFYCIVNQWIKPGDRFECDIAVPVHDRGRSGDAVYLRCRVLALRIEPGPTGADFGLACRIEDYQVIHGSGQDPLAERGTGLRPVEALG
jgi:PilZ domain